MWGSISKRQAVGRIGWGRRRLTVAASSAAALAALALVPGASPAQAGFTIPSLPSTNPADNIPWVVNDDVEPNAGVYELRQVGDTMYAGGDFHAVANADGSGVRVRENIVAFDPVTGAVLDVPNLRANGVVWAIEPSADGAFLYIGGQFTTFSGRTASRVVKFNRSTNQVDTTFRSPVGGGHVTDLQLVGGRLFISGTFAGGILSADPNTGARTSYLNGVQAAGSEGGNGQAFWSTRIYRFAVNPAGTRMAVIGSFTSIGGQPRQQAAVVNLGVTATVNPWTSATWNRNCITGLQWYTRDVDWAPSGTYFVIGTTGGAITNTFCDTATRWNVDAAGTVSGQPAWVQYTGGDTIHAVTVTDRAVFLSGHFRWLDNPDGRNSMGPGAARIQGIGAVDPATGRAIRTWNPTKSLEGGRGGYDIYFTGRGLWLGHFEQELGHEDHPGLGLLPF